MPYTFQSVKDAEKSKRCLVNQSMRQRIWKSFLYYILTTSEEGEEICLDIYCAGSGPAVGGTQDEKSESI